MNVHDADVIIDHIFWCLIGLVIVIGIVVFYVKHSGD